MQWEQEEQQHTVQDEITADRPEPLLLKPVLASLLDHAVTSKPPAVWWSYHLATWGRMALLCYSETQLCYLFRLINFPPNVLFHWKCVCVVLVSQTLIPGIRGPFRGLDSAMPISVMPYRSSRVCPVMSCHRCRVGRGRAAEPETMSLKREANKERNYRFHVQTLMTKRRNGRWVRLILLLSGQTYRSVAKSRKHGGTKYGVNAPWQRFLISQM